MPDPKSFNDVYAALANLERKRIGAAYAEAYGPPPESEPFTDGARIKLAWTRWPRAWAGQPESDHPSGERINELLQAGFVDEAVALHAFPFLEVAYTRGIDGLDAQVRMAAKIARNAPGFMLGEAEEDSAPSVPPPALSDEPTPTPGPGSDESGGGGGYGGL